MKKSYINPAIVIINVAPTTPLAASTPGLTVDWEGNVDAANVEVKGYNGRAGSVDWDDDWSE
jgi:hypothetical protein